MQERPKFLLQARPNTYSEVGMRDNSDSLHNNSIKWGNEFKGLMLHMGIESRFKADATELPVIDIREPGTIG